jgi:tetratricopeptide (TPR) repeat protein
VLATVEPSIRELYHLFLNALKNKVFLEPATACANAYYERLIAEPKLARLHSSMTRNYSAALQDGAQQVMNTMLKNGLTIDVLSGKNADELYGDYPAWLDRAAELLGKEHYMYKTLQARKSFFEGKIALTWAARRKDFQKALEWQPDLPHAFVELISTCSTQEVDSAEFFARKAMELVPGWVVPYLRLSIYYDKGLKKTEKAESLLNEASLLDSNSVILWYHKANFYSDHGAFEKAILWYKKALDHTGEGICFNCALNNLGDTYLQAGYYEEA